MGGSLWSLILKNVNWYERAMIFFWLIPHFFIIGTAWFNPGFLMTSWPDLCVPPYSELYMY